MRINSGSLFLSNKWILRCYGVTFPSRLNSITIVLPKRSEFIILYCFTYHCLRKAWISDGVDKLGPRFCKGFGWFQNNLKQALGHLLKLSVRSIELIFSKQKWNLDCICKQSEEPKLYPAFNSLTHTYHNMLSYFAFHNFT